MLYIIEHLEPELYQWCWLEYEHISQIVGKDKLMFTNIKTEVQKKKLLPFGKVEKRSVTELNLHRVCILDPFAEKILVPEDTQKFDYVVFGGILGDHPMKARTKIELTKKMKKAKARNIGQEQFPTDNAVYVVKAILEEGKIIGHLHFQDQIVIPMKEGEEIIMPFRYVLVHGKPLLSFALLHYLKNKKGF